MLDTLLNVRTNNPTVIIGTTGKVHDVNILDQLPIEAGATYLFIPAYLDCARLYRIHQSQAFFVTCAESTTRLPRLHSHPVEKTTGLQCDQAVVFANLNPAGTTPRNCDAFATAIPRAANGFSSSPTTYRFSR